jgi:FkbH-like protein
MVRVESPSAINAYLLKIEFKRWAKLWSPANISLLPTAQAGRVEKRDYRVGSILYQLPVPANVKRVITGKRYSLKKRSASRPARNEELPTSFLVECYNPGNLSVRLSLTMRPVNDEVRIPFQELIEIAPGFNRIRIEMSDIYRVIDIRRPFNVELIPDEAEKLITLYFGLTDFVVEKESKRQESSKVKCVVWDLDNTLWEGVLVEDGSRKLALKPGVIDIIRTLDQRGILHSIASKNNFDEAMEALRELGIDEYFLSPQISWRPKSESIATIVRELNIGVDSLVFVDDSQFELEQVKAMHPNVRVLNALQWRTLNDMDECQAAVTAESRERRKMYRVEAMRREVADGFSDDYMTFLRHCEIRLSIGPMTSENLNRVHELTQRTNQMNFSGNRYERHLLEEVLRTPYLETFVLSCEDRFGSYGIVGFSIVDLREPRLTDMMFSCRIQSKRVEHAFLSFIIRKSIAETERDFFANYRRTPRNAPSGKVFDDIGMEEVEARDGVSSLLFRRGKEVPNDGVIRIVVEEAASRVI